MSSPGKSLDQLRKTQTGDDASLQQPPPQAAATAARVIVPSNSSANLAPASIEIVSPQSKTMAVAASAPSRPKGKDFMSMSARQPPPQPTQQVPLATASPHASTQVSSHGPSAGGKPKGKDFSQMASRMGSLPQEQQSHAPPPLQQQQQQQQQQPFQRTSSTESSSQQAVRAVQMREAARAAAGMPPLDRAASNEQQLGSQLPSNNSQLLQMVQQPTYQQTPTQQPYLQHQMQQKSLPAGYSLQQPLQASSSQHRGPVPMPQQQHQLQQQQRRRASGSGSLTPPAPTPDPAAFQTKKTRENSKPTPAPTLAADSRLSSSQVSAGAHRAPLIGPRIQQLVAELDPSYTLDSQAEQQILLLADDFLDGVCNKSLKLAQHRGSKVMEIQDVQFVLQKQYGITIPGLSPLPTPTRQGISLIMGNAKSGTATLPRSNVGGAKRKNPADGSANGPSPAKKTKSAGGNLKSKDLK